MSDNNNNKEFDVIASVMRLSRALRRQPPRPPMGGEGFVPPEGRGGPGCGHGRVHGRGCMRPGMAPPPGGMPPFGAPSDMPRESMVRLMKALAGNDGVSSRELAEMLDIRPSSLTELLARAEKQGMIVRTADPDDKRVTRVSLSEDGKKAIEQTEAPFRAHMEQMTACFTDEEKAEFCRLCAKLADHIEQLNKDNSGDESCPRGGHGFGRGFGHGRGHGPMGHMPPPPPFGIPNGMPPFGMPPFGETPDEDDENGADGEV